MGEDSGCHLFVFGTLRHGHARGVESSLLRGAVLVGAAWMRGRLYLVADYPGAIDADDPSSVVRGEVWRVEDERILPELDAYEECGPEDPEPHLYRRERRPVTLAGGRSVDAWVYLYNRSLAGLAVIPSGDFREAPIPRPPAPRR